LSFHRRSQHSISVRCSGSEVDEEAAGHAFDFGAALAVPPITPLAEAGSKGRFIRAAG
jgi:hypothetical protein